MFSLLQAGAASDGRPPAVAWGQETLVKPAAAVAQRIPLSVLDQLAAPTVFLELALIYGGGAAAADPALLARALQRAVDHCPCFAARAVSGEGGRLELECGAGAGAAFMQGSSTASALGLDALQAQIVADGGGGGGSSGPGSCRLLGCPELTGELFGRLPGALQPSYVDRQDAPPLTSVALVTLEGGGFVLALRTSHLLGDFSSLRLLLRLLTAAYNEQQQQQAAAGGGGGNAAPPAAGAGAAELPPAELAAPVLGGLVAEAARQLPAGFQPVRLKPLAPQDEQLFQRLAALGSGTGGDQAPRPRRLCFHAPPARLQQLKDEALSSARGATAGAGAGDGAAAPGGAAADAARWCTSHNVLLARLAQAFCGLPGRADLPHDISVAVDMRTKLGPSQQQQQQQQAGPWLVGNFFASAIAESCLACRSTLGELAQKLHEAVGRARDLWLPDLAWASSAMGLLGEQGSDQQQQQQVTWARLHAMGPRCLLRRQVELSLLASLSTTQWPLDFAADAALGGEQPLLAVPAFSQPQPFPLALLQPATPAMGGGLLLHVFVDESEAAELQAAAVGRL